MRSICLVAVVAALVSSGAVVAGEQAKVIATFEDRNPFGQGTVVTEHASEGAKALRIDKGWISMEGRQNWSGYDYIKADVYTDAKKPLKVYFEVRDTKTTGYWTRVNYNTIVPPGKSTLTIPTNLYVGEKSRPGRPLDVKNITRLVYSIGGKPAAPLFIDNIRLERDDAVRKAVFDGLWAFDLGTPDSPVLEGFRQITKSSGYNRGRGYGLKNARIWNLYRNNMLQPEPLYQDFLCIEGGGLAIDVPNGKYHVFVNMDSPSGFWGEYQRYRERSLIVEGVEHKDTMDLESFKKRYFRFWDVEDLPTENTFDKFQEAYFDEKALDVEVTDGQLNIEFKGQNWACTVSAIVAYPHTKKAQGERFMKFMKDRRRWHFDNYFKRVLHTPTGEVPKQSRAESRRGFILFSRDYMSDVYYNDRPGAGESAAKLEQSAFAGEYEPLTFSVYPLKDLGTIEVKAGDLRSGRNSIPADSIDVGYVLNRVSRVTMEGSVYTIKPRHLMPRSSVAAPAGITRRFWLTVRVPKETPAGLYRGRVAVSTEKGGSANVPVEFRVFPGVLDEADVPAGPWGHSIGLPWYGDETGGWTSDMALKSLKKLREYGLTSFSGLPVVRLNGWKDGKPQLDFSTGDAQMARAKATGFKMPVITYCRLPGLNLYYKDASALKKSGMTDYSEFIKVLFTAIQKHADEAGWLPVYWNLGDEPIGENLTKSAENAEAYKKAFPKGPPYFTAASSYSGSDPKDPHFRLAKALHVVDWNGHSETSVKLLHDTGSDWAFYNGGNRWTYGIYMYKAVKQFGMKFRLSWHWNVVAGDPYYALDCREDDYAWCNSSPDGELIPSLTFERSIREGVDDYRYMLTLARLAREKNGTPAAAEAEKLIAERMAAFKLGQRNHDAIFPRADWKEFRLKMAEAIAKLR